MNSKQPLLPYSVFIENRPVRVAFFVNPQERNSFERIQGIIEYNHGKWGGRYNPIILTNGKTIKKEWWQFLTAYDPDIIKSYVSINKSLLKRINDNLTPYLVEDYKKSLAKHPSYRPHITDEGLSILPTAENIAQVTRFSLKRTHLVLFEINENKKNEIKRFLKINFGTYEPMLNTSKIIREYPNRKELKIENKKEFTKAISKLNTFDTFVYPSLICSIPSSSVDSKHDHREEAFTIVVGDSVDELVYYWNRIFAVSDYRQTKLNSLWLSKKLLSKSGVTEALNAWIKRAVDPSGSQDNDVRFVSFTLSESELTNIATQVLENTYFRRSVKKHKEILLPKFSRQYHLHTVESRLHPIRVSGDEAHITVSPPKLQEGFMGGEHWMTDVYIKFRPERFTYVQGKDYWWQLPQNNDLSHRLFHKPSRICKNGIPSVLLKRNTSISPYSNNKIKIELLDDWHIFRILIVGDRRPVYNSDPRTSLARRPYNVTRRSDKGRYLSGFLDLFSGLHNAHSFFESSYWRRMFDILSHQNPQKDEVRKQAIYNKLRKENIRRKFDTDESLEWLSEYILKTSKDQASGGKELPHLSFKKEALSELEEYNNQNKQNKFSFSHSALKRDLAYLINSGILVVGIKPRCRSCGLASFYHVDEAKQTVECKGCGYQFGLPPELIWYYRLNSLIQVGVARHYLIPVIMVLGQLLHDAKSSFIFTTSLDLFNKRSSERPIGDLDVVCIQDGKFIIGEVKNSCSLFKQKHFDNMGLIAKKIKPDKVIFSSLEKKPTTGITKKIGQLAKKLEKDSIEVEWFSFPYWVFEPRPL